MNGYRITEARQDDLSAIVDIYNSTIDGRLATADLSPATVESRQSWLDAHGGNRPLYVLKNQEGELLAWGGFSDYYPREAYRITAEISIYVRHDMRGVGVGKILVRYMLEKAPSLGIKTSSPSSSATTTPASACSTPSVSKNGGGCRKSATSKPCRPTSSFWAKKPSTKPQAV